MKRRQQGNISDYFKPQKERTEGTSDNKIPKDTSTNDADDAETIAQIAENTENTETIKIAEKPNQPSSTFSFPKTNFGKQQRSCQAKWFSEYKWLDYDESRDCVTCFICKKHSKNLTAEISKDAFLSAGFNNWKKALDSFKDHQKSKLHVAALSLEFVVPECGNIREMTSENLKTKMIENRKCLLKIIETIRFLGRQGLALRGREDDENSNFWQLLKLRTKDFPILKEWTERKSEKYTSHDIQNEILSLMAHEIVRDLSDEIRETFFATICDEYTDVSNKEQLTICLRWVDDYLESHEDFMGFYELTNIKSETIVAAIKDALLRTQLSLDKCRGQCYDGASNMLGKKSGVATQISNIQPKAVVTHCHCHSLNLSVKETTKESKLLTDVMSVTSEIAALIKYSPKREQQLRSIKLMYEDSANSISKLSTTRWTVRANSFQRVIENYESLSHLWDVCLDESGLTDDIKGRIVGCKSKMESFDYYFGLKVGKMLLSHTDKLSQTLQGAKMSAVSSKRLAMLTVHTISSLRNEESFNALYDLCLQETE